MLFNLLAPLADEWSPLNVFRYQTFRSGSAILFAFFMTLYIGPHIIRWLKLKQREGQPIREDGPESHLLTKKGTPTMGGLMFLISACATTLLWADLSKRLCLGRAVGHARLRRHRLRRRFPEIDQAQHQGLPGRVKLVAQFGIGLVAALWVVWLAPEPLSTGLTVPFFKDLLIPFGMFFPLFTTLVMMGSSNAVNLTDGLDGLAIVPVMMAAASLGFIAYVAGNFNFAVYLQLHHVVGAGELAVFCGALWRRGPWLPVVQRAAGHGVHGRYRLAQHGRARSAPSRSSPSTSWCWPSSAACSCSRPSPSSCRWCRSRPPAAGCSAWRRCTITSRKRAGRADHRHPLLDHRRGAGADRPCHPETALRNRTQP